MLALADPEIRRKKKPMLQGNKEVLLPAGYGKNPPLYCPTMNATGGRLGGLPYITGTTPPV